MFADGGLPGLPFGKMLAPIAKRSRVPLEIRRPPDVRRHDEDGDSLVPVALRQQADPQQRARCARVARAVARAFEPSAIVANATALAQPSQLPSHARRRHRSRSYGFSRYIVVTMAAMTHSTEPVSSCSSTELARF